MFFFIVNKLLTQKKHYCFKINDKQRMKMPEKCDYVKFRNFERKIKSSFMFYADFEIILEPQNNAKQNTDVPYTNKS